MGGGVGVGAGRRGSRRVRRRADAGHRCRDGAGQNVHPLAFSVGFDGVHHENLKEESFLP